MLSQLCFKQYSYFSCITAAFITICVLSTLCSCDNREIRTFTFGPYGGITNPIDRSHHPNDGLGVMTIGTKPYEGPFVLPIPHIVLPVILPNEGTIKALRVRVLALGGSGPGKLVTFTLYRKAWNGGLLSDTGKIVAQGHVTESQRGQEYTNNVTGLSESIVDSDYYFLAVYGDKSFCSYLLLGGFQVDVEMAGNARYWRG